MAPKFIAIPGSASEEEIELLGGKFLGIGYNIKEDKIAFSLDTLVKVKRSGDRKSSSIRWGRAEVEAMRRGDYPLTLRMALSWTMGTFDPLGLMSPFLLKAKMALRRLQGKGGPILWDQTIALEEKRHWADILEEILESETVFFPRVAAPPEGTKTHVVVEGGGNQGIP